MKTLTRIAMVLSLGMVVPANAALITIEPDGYAAGTNLSQSVSSVNLWNFHSSGGTGAFGDVYAAVDARCATRPGDCQATTGNTVFSREQDGHIENYLAGRWGEAGAARDCFQRMQTGPCSPYNSFDALLIGFNTATNFVEISGSYLMDWPILFAFDSSRNLIGGGHGCCNTFHGTGPDAGDFSTSTLAFSSGSANIAYVIAAGWSAPSSLDALRYNDMSVPEPGTALLLAVGLAAMFGLRRRRLRAGPSLLRG